MVEFIPIMLFILGWHPDKPGEVSFERPEVLFVSPAACEEAGAAMAKRMTEAASEKSGATYEHRCMPIPSNDEFEAVFKQLRKPRQ